VGSVAVCDQMRAVDKARLVRCISKLSESDLLALGNGVRQVLGVP
jgi:mRNA-degrading endonuclease toxin of MazEF toxin-antitoxin module